jgi:hypothetical protein
MLAVLKVFWLRFCQIVSRKNRIERVIYARLCLAANYNFYTTVFIDEHTFGQLTIDHINRVVKAVIKLNGKATGL